MNDSAFSETLSDELLTMGHQDDPLGLEAHLDDNNEVSPQKSVVSPHFHFKVNLSCNKLKILLGQG